MRTKKNPEPPAVRFMLEFTGWRVARLDEDGCGRRPLTEVELIGQISDYFEWQAREAGLSEFRVEVKLLD